MSLSVRLPVFEGPLHLLLHLVSKERLDVAEVSVAIIAREYLETVSGLPELDLEEATSFLVLASTLLELKSYKLLPGSAEDGAELSELLEERDRLLHRLVQLATFKRAGDAIGESLRRNEGIFARRAPWPEELRGAVGELPEDLRVGDLAEAAARALSPKPRPVVDTTFVAPLRVNLAEVIARMAGEIKVWGRTSFRELWGGSPSRIGIVVSFLALLELLRSDSVAVEQAEPCGEILVAWRDPARGKL